MIRKLALVVLLLLPVQMTGQAKDEVTIEVTPENSAVLGRNQRSHRRVIVRFLEHELNRKIILEWTSPDGEEGKTERQINNELAFSDFGGSDGFSLPPGKYQFKVTLYRSDRKEFTAITVTTVTLASEASKEGEPQ